MVMLYTIPYMNIAILCVVLIANFSIRNNLNGD